MRGGYVIIDLKDVNLDPEATTAAVIPGTFKAIEGNHRKAILLSNVVLDGVEVADRFVTTTVFTSEVVGTVYEIMMDIGKIEINEDDEVTYDPEAGYNGVMNAIAAQSLPGYDEGDVGKILRVGNDVEPEWKASAPVPACDEEDVGKVLKVNASGLPEWTTLE